MTLLVFSESHKRNVSKMISHKFGLSNFQKAIKTANDPGEETLEKATAEKDSSFLKYFNELISFVQNPKSPSIKAVIFDLDGTLSSFNLDYKTVRLKVKELLEEKAVPASLLSLNESVFEMLRKTEKWAKSTGQPPSFVEEAKGQASIITEKHEIEAASQTDLLPGVKETLEAVRKSGMKIGLCTINSDKSVSYILDRFCIAQYFDVTLARNQVKNVKPHPEHIEAALKILGVTPNEAIVIGDSSVDMKSASALGMIAVGLPTGVSTIEQLKENGANYIITSMYDLPALIREIKLSQESGERGIKI